VRHGDGALGVFAESAADSEAARGRGLNQVLAPQS
jgi:hypothetical protein